MKGWVEFVPLYSSSYNPSTETANLDSMERIWFDQRKFEDHECKLVEHVAY